MQRRSRAGHGLSHDPGITDLECVGARAPRSGFQVRARSPHPLATRACALLRLRCCSLRSLLPPPPRSLLALLDAEGSSKPASSSAWRHRLRRRQRACACVLPPHALRRKRRQRGAACAPPTVQRLSVPNSRGQTDTRIAPLALARTLPPEAYAVNCSSIVLATSKEKADVWIKLTIQPCQNCHDILLRIVYPYS